MGKEIIFTESFEKEFAKIEAQMPAARVKDSLKSQLVGRPLVLYGAGSICNVALNYCEMECIDVLCICDSRKTGNHGSSGLLIISPKQLLADYSNAVVMIASWRYEREISNFLTGLGIHAALIYPFRPYSMTLDDFKQKYYSGYKWAFDFFHDELSKKLILDKVRSYLLDEPLKPNTSSKAYLDDSVVALFGKDEVIVDAGAYTGDTAELFINLVSGEYSHLWAFEPDASSLKQAAANLSEYPNVDIIPKGLWREETELTFYGVGDMDSTFIRVSNPTDGFSFVSANAARNTVSVTSLDSFFKDKPDDELPTFIKMDIEGSEKEALLGAENIIKRVKPKLAIAVEHKPDDIFEITRMLYSMRDDYRFALRQYDYNFTETVLYGV